MAHFQPPICLEVALIYQARMHKNPGAQDLCSQVLLYPNLLLTTISSILAFVFTFYSFSKADIDSCKW